MSRRETRKQNIARRNAKVVREYEAMRAERKNGIPVYTHKYIIGKVADDNHLSPSTVEGIIYRVK